MTDWDSYTFPEEKKESRKERKKASRTDRSQFKKTDQDKIEKVSETELKGLLRGRVLSIFSEGIEVLVGDDRLLCTLRGSLKKDKTQKQRLVAVGDFVRLERIDEDEGVIVHVEERVSTLSRAHSVHRRKEQILAANIDQVLITISVVIPLLKPFLVDRYIIAAKSGNMEPVIVVNKIDLLENNPEEQILYQDFIEAYEGSGFQILSISAETGEGIDELKKVMKGKASVFSGQSGTGKTSLINAAIGLNLQVGDTIEKTKKGSHTTTRALPPSTSPGHCSE